MADLVATVLAFLFREDKKEHPMPQQASDALFQKVKLFIKRKEDIQNGEE